MLRWLDLSELHPGAALSLSSCPPRVRRVVLRPGTVARFFDAGAQPTARLEHVSITPVPGEESDEPLQLSTLPATLTTLHLEHCGDCWRVWPSPLRALPRECIRNLSELSLRGTFRDTQGITTKLAGLEQLTQLRTLDLSHNRGVGVPEMQLVGQLRTLTALDITAIRALNQESLRRLRSLQGLTTLLMTDTPWTDVGLDGLAELVHFPRLRRLSLPDPSFVEYRHDEARPVWHAIATKLCDLRELQMDARLYLSTLDLRTDEELPPATSVEQVAVLWRSKTKRRFRWFHSKRLFPLLRTLRFHRVKRLTVHTVHGLQMLARCDHVTVTVLDSDDVDRTQRLFEQAPFLWPGAPAPLDLDMHAMIAV
jgi:hypothetical protein